MQKVALLGLGIMGAGMAGNLLRKGFALTVWNRTRAKADPLVAEGAQVADTPREAVQGAEVVVSMVGDDPASRAVWLGDDGALSGAAQGAVLVECSTLTPDWVRELGALAAAQGCGFLDAPVAGTKPAAANGTLVLFVGGEAASLEKARPTLEAFSQRMVHLGPVGTGATWKLINNMMAAVHVVALAEGLNLAERVGMNMETVTPLILNGATGSPMVHAKLPRMVEGRYADTDFALQWMHKDTSYAVQLGEAFGLPLKMVEAARAVFADARTQGLDDQDFAAVIETLRAKARM
jgi:3-hydroxyisobutyrate dehydrogenase